jgi:hypothetical protein
MLLTLRISNEHRCDCNDGTDELEKCGQKAAAECTMESTPSHWRREFAIFVATVQIRLHVPLWTALRPEAGGRRPRPGPGEHSECDDGLSQGGLGAERLGRLGAEHWDFTARLAP